MKKLKKSVVPKMKWVDLEDNESQGETYRVTFDCYPEDLERIIDEVTSYGTHIKTEREVVDHG
jgi:hypothetical protein